MSVGLTIAVVIPVFNEAENLPALLDSLLRQTRRPDRIVVTDAGSSDGSREILAGWSSRLPELTVLLEPGAYPGRGRNRAIAAVQTDIVAQIDGGSTADSGWLEKITGPILAGEADYVTGAILPMPVLKSIRGREINLAELYAVTLFSGARHSGVVAGGSSVAYRRCIWERAGGFPEWPRTSEDRMFAGKARHYARKTTFASDALVYWQLGPGISDLWHRLHGATLNHFLLPPFRSSWLQPLLLWSGLLFFSALAFFWTPLIWILPGLALILLWLRRWRSAGHRLRRLTDDNSSITSRKGILLGGLAGLKLAAQFSGLTLGLLRWPERRRNREKYQEYMAARTGDAK